MAKQKVEAGQTRRVGNTAATYFIHAFSRWPGRASWVVEWGKKSATGKRYDVGRRTEDAILGDILVRNADGSAVESQEPVQARTEVRVMEDGWVNMFSPGSNDDFGHHQAQQGAGYLGWTCIGFIFDEVPDVVYPFAQGWVNADNPSPSRIELIRSEDYAKGVVAKFAIWEKANG